MCKFFSCLSDGKGKLFYLDAEMRNKVGENDSPDSHSFIVEYLAKEELLAKSNRTQDRLNSWEYNPLTKNLNCDQMNTRDDTKAVHRQLDAMDWKTIVPQLNVKELFNPLEDRARHKVTRHEIDSLRQWALIGDAAKASVEDYIWASVGDVVRASVRDSVWALFGNLAGNLVGKSVRYSVEDLVWAYISSFFDDKGENPLQCGIDLWEAGLFPSFDGTTWRIHTGRQAKVIFEISAKQLREEVVK